MFCPECNSNDVEELDDSLFECQECYLKFDDDAESLEDEDEHMEGIW